MGENDQNEKYAETILLFVRFLMTESKCDIKYAKQGHGIAFFISSLLNIIQLTIALL